MKCIIIFSDTSEADYSLPMVMNSHSVVSWKHWKFLFCFYDAVLTRPIKFILQDLGTTWFNIVTMCINRKKIDISMGWITKLKSDFVKFILGSKVVEGCGSETTHFTHIKHNFLKVFTILL